MVEFSRRKIASLLLAGAIATGLISPALALTVEELAQQIANAPTPEMIQAAIAAAEMQGLNPAEIAQAFGQAYQIVTLNNANNSGGAEGASAAGAAIMSSFESFKMEAGLSAAVLNAAFSVGSGGTMAVAAAAVTASEPSNASAYLAPTTPAAPTNDNPSPH